MNLGMSRHYLEKIFAPSSIAVIGASDKPGSVGMKVFRNLSQEAFNGKIYAINPKHDQVQDKPCFSSVKKIKESIDLAVIATPAKTLPDIIVECGEKGIRAAIILSSGFSEIGKDGQALEKTVLDLAKHYQIHLVGPNCLGIMRPHFKMNATFDNNFALPGSIALVSQSGALSAGILDWAMNKKIGFSAIVSLGNNADIDFGDILDYLMLDPHTKSILLYIEGIKNARHFMSSLRAAARVKPVIVIKSGKNSQGSRAALSHTGALIGGDDVFDEALRRAGAVRVLKIEDLFLASQILSSSKKIKGKRLIVVTNGGGAGVMAADRASELNVELSALTKDMVTQFNEVLPSQWSHQNPIDIIGDATPERYHAALDICKQSKHVDGILAILVPVSMSDPFKVAKQIVHDAKKNNKPILACWMGEKQVKSSWKLFAKHNIPYFDTPEKAVEAFSYLADYYHNQKLLMQVPAPLSRQFKPDIAKARAMIDAVLAQGRSLLTTYESKEILKLFGIPVTVTIEANTVVSAIDAAKLVGFPIVMKINSPSISHKSEIGGVCMDIRTEAEVRDAFKKIMDHVKSNSPNAEILGVTIESQCYSPFNREIMIGVANDIVFGPVISFGAGGTLVEIMEDRALALPPLNHFMTQQLISKTRILKLCAKLRNISEEQLESIVNVLLSVSEMVCELPQIQEMDINPLILNEMGVIAVDARIIVKQNSKSLSSYDHLAIHPYPNDLISSHQLSDETVITVRPIRPEDAELEQEFTRNLSAQSKYFRFMEHFREFSTLMLVRLTQIDYDREMALVAIYKEAIIGISRYVINPDKKTAEFSLVVADAWHGKGVGTILMNKLGEIAKLRNLKELVGAVFANNVDMLELTRHLGFKISSSEDPKVKIVTKRL
jgi:acetyltransferase